MLWVLSAILNNIAFISKNMYNIACISLEIYTWAAPAFKETTKFDTTCMPLWTHLFTMDHDYLWAD